ncbi:MAG: hypothetical protein IPI24_04205 [Ignavibacteria bacterium]|nr:hypothetical protein [Ignavibacteria bacterium]MBK7576619.1 hypothetical protein [Ignavibacteria bacterium]MBK9181761.1 hypothetical protein [Ignavibacteria bacterium]
MNTVQQIAGVLERYPSICLGGYGHHYLDENWEGHLELNKSHIDESQMLFWDGEHCELTQCYQSEFRKICRRLRDIKKDAVVNLWAGSEKVHEDLASVVGEFPHGLLIVAAAYMGFSFDPQDDGSVCFNFEFDSYYNS